MSDETYITRFPEIREPLLREKSSPGKNKRLVPEPFDPFDGNESLTAGDLPDLPDVSEPETVRHFTRLSRLNYGIDHGMYPLGSCTMKYNPKILEEIAGRICPIHPSDKAGMKSVLGHLKLLQGCLEEICGMDASCLWPAAGAHGELTGMMVISKAIESRGESRKKVLIPDTAHGTNPSSCTLAGFVTENIPSCPDGFLRAEILKEYLDSDVAAVMITNPNTLGIFEAEIHKIADLLHENGSLLYMDGANLNAIMGAARPGDMGVDCMHVNLHKTFGTPHGGGGPGSGPVLVKKHLTPFLPVPRIISDNKGEDTLWWDAPESIGSVHGFLGNVGVLIKALVYILSLGGKGIKDASQTACLNANYLRTRLKKSFDLPYDTPTLHEFVLSDKIQSDSGVTTLDMAKALMDHAFHPPTVYFPLVVHGSIMVEPTETESIEELDRFVCAMEEIARMAQDDPESLHSSPITCPTGRLDEVWAARNLVLSWNSLESKRYTRLSK